MYSFRIGVGEHRPGRREIGAAGVMADGVVRRPVRVDGVVVQPHVVHQRDRPQRHATYSRCRLLSHQCDTPGTSGNTAIASSSRANGSTIASGGGSGAAVGWAACPPATICAVAHCGQPKPKAAV